MVLHVRSWSLLSLCLGLGACTASASSSTPSPTSEADVETPGADAGSPAPADGGTTAAPADVKVDGVPVTFGSVAASLRTKTGNLVVRGWNPNPASAGDLLNWESFDVDTPGAPGTYDCASRRFAVFYSTADHGKDYSAQGGPGTSCAIEILESGPVGGTVRGRFSATLVHNNGENGTDGSSHVIEGSFQLVRSADEI